MDSATLRTAKATSFLTNSKPVPAAQPHAETTARMIATPCTSVANASRPTTDLLVLVDLATVGDRRKAKVERAKVEKASTEKAKEVSID